MLRRLILLLALFALSTRVWAQDALNLPTDLYVLLNDGRIDRYGVGAAGVQTVTPPGAYVIDFGIDARGERLAYRTEQGLYVTLIPTATIPMGDPIQLEGTSAGFPYFRGAGDTIAWAPAGDALAYTTLDGARVYFQGGGNFVDLTESPMLALSWSPGGRFLAAQADQNVWWIYRRDGSSLALTSIITASMGTAWVSDAELVFAPPEGSLRVMNLDAANAQSVLLDNTVQYRLPILNREDALQFFARDPNTDMPEGFGMLMRLQRGATQVETVGQIPVALPGLRWTPDGSLLVAFQGGVIALYDPTTGLGFPLPIEGAVAFSWGSLSNPTPAALPTDLPAPEVALPTLPAATEAPPAAPTAPAATVTALVLSEDAYFLAPDFNGTLQVWRMPANGAPPGQFTGSLDDVGEYAISPDGSVAYVVTGELWIQPFSRAAPYYLTDISSFAPTTLSYSPDGQQIAFADEERGIFTVPINRSEEPSLIISNLGSVVYRRPQWSPDGTELLIDIYQGEQVWTGVFDLEADVLIEAPRPDDPADTRAARSRWLADGRAFTYADASAPSAVPEGFYVFDPLAVGTVPAQWIPFSETVSVRSALEVLPNVIRAITAEGDQLSVMDFDLANARQTPILALPPLSAPRLSPNGRFVAGYENVVERMGSLVFIDLQNGRRYQLTTPETSMGFSWRGG
ncbi:MAG: hypothetical protein IAE80_11605 [Anaerolinea sp.]|nr:hypothetical protein [Anaerolinea sp.]